MKIEEKSIQFIPENERHGSVKSLFTIWFGANMQIFAIITGALAIVCGLNVAWAIVAILLGDLCGGIFMAYHSAQGPQLGVPQMIQSRAQFGVKGAILPLIVVVLMYIGYLASTTILGAQVIEQTNIIPFSSAVVICNIITLFITIYGYDMIHKLEKYISITFAVIFAYITILAIALPYPEGSFSFGPVNFGMFFLVVSIIAAFEISYAPYVADYSRYLPKKTSVAAAFWYTYSGSVSAAIWMHVLGALLAAGIVGFVDNPVQSVAGIVSSPMTIIVYLAILIGVLVVNALNLYGAFMSIITTVEPFTNIRGNKKSRIIFMTSITAVCTAISIWGFGDFMADVSSFLVVILYFMIPWTAINLVDFYFVKHGEYSIEDIFDVNGKYGKYNWKSLGTYILTVVIEVPFMNTPLYVGPVANALGGADLAWIVGLAFASITYYIIAKGEYNIANQTVVEE